MKNYALIAMLLSVLLLFSGCSSSLDIGETISFPDGIHIIGANDSSADNVAGDIESDVTDNESQSSKPNKENNSSNNETEEDTSSEYEDDSSSGDTDNNIYEVKNVENVIRENAKNLKLSDEVLKRSILNQGDMSRVATVIRKAIQGKPVTIGFIGGSITNGSGASSTSNSYAYLFKKWWEETFPKSKLTYINAGIGATDSLIGVHRIDADLLDKNPDLVFVEFAVNDKSNNNELFKETYESLIRKVLKKNNSPAVIQLSMMDENGVSMQVTHSQVGEHYNIPMISYKKALWPSGGLKVYNWSEIGVDNVHPNNTGHAVASELLIYYINTVRAQIESVSTDISTNLPQPITASGFENAVLYTNQTITADSLGSFKVNNNAFYQFRYGWSVNGGKDPIVFNVNAKKIYLLYMMDKSSGKAGTVTVSLDSQALKTINSDASGSWGDHALYFEAINTDTTSEHSLEVALTTSGTKSNFTILGIMIS